MKPNKEDKKHYSNLQDALNYFQDQQSTLDDKFNEKSEKWQESDAGEKMQQELSDLEDFCNSLEAAISELENTYEFTE